MVEKQTTKLADVIVDSFKHDRKLLICGNGGSAAEADHMAAELVGKFEHDNRPALPALALSCSGAILTSLGNDRGYEEVFARQIEAFGKDGDILLVITTSDASDSHSTNLLRALETAKEKGVQTAGLVSKERTSNLLDLLDYPILCEGDNTATIQENQIRVVHSLCRQIEKHFI